MHGVPCVECPQSDLPSSCRPSPLLSLPYLLTPLSPLILNHSPILPSFPVTLHYFLPTPQPFHSLVYSSPLFQVSFYSFHTLPSHLSTSSFFILCSPSPLIRISSVLSTLPLWVLFILIRMTHFKYSFLPLSLLRLSSFQLVTNSLPYPIFYYYHLALLPFFLPLLFLPLPLYGDHFLWVNLTTIKSKGYWLIQTVLQNQISLLV